MNGSNRGITRGPLFEPLEPRLLLSADLAMGGQDAAGTVEIINAAAQEAEPCATAQPCQVSAWIDPRLLEVQDHIEAQKAIDPDYDASELWKPFLHVTADGRMDVRVVLDEISSAMMEILEPLEVRPPCVMPYAGGWVSYLSLDAVAAVPGVRRIEPVGPDPAIDPRLAEKQGRIEKHKAWYTDPDLSELSSASVHVNANGDMEVLVRLDTANEETLGLLEAAGLRAYAVGDEGKSVQGWAACGCLSRLVTTPGVTWVEGIGVDPVVDPALLDMRSRIEVRKAVDPDYDASELTAFGVHVDADGRMEVVVRLDWAYDYLEPLLRAAGLERTSAHGGAFARGWISYSSLDALLAVRGVSTLEAVSVHWPFVPIPDNYDDAVIGRSLHQLRTLIETRKAIEPSYDPGELGEPFNVTTEGEIEVRIELDTFDAEVMEQLEAAGVADSVRVLELYRPYVRGWISYLSVDALAAVSGVSRLDAVTYPRSPVLLDWPDGSSELRQIDEAKQEAGSAYEVSMPDSDRDPCAEEALGWEVLGELKAAGLRMTGAYVYDAQTEMWMGYRSCDVLGGGPVGEGGLTGGDEPLVADPTASGDPEPSGLTAPEPATTDALEPAAGAGTVSPILAAPEADREAPSQTKTIISDEYSSTDAEVDDDGVLNLLPGMPLP